LPENDLDIPNTGSERGGDRIGARKSPDLWASLRGNSLKGMNIYG